MNRILQVCFLIFALLGFSAHAHAQYVAYTLAGQQHGGGIGTFSTVQVGHCTISSGASTCTATMSQALVAGNLDIFGCSDPNTSPGTAGANYITGVTAGGTFKLSTAASVGGYTTGGASQWKTSGYILPSTSTGGSATEVITLNQNSSSTGGNCYVAELHPSANPNNVGLDDDSNYEPSAASTSNTNINLVLSGTNDAIFQDFNGISSYGAASAVTSPYSTNLYNGSFSSFSVAPTPSNGNGPTWTSSSLIPIMGALAFGWNVSPCNPQSIVQFGAGTSGNAPAASDLVSGMKGWAGGNWTLSFSAIVYNNAVNMGLLNATGRLCDGSSAASGSGATQGLSFTGTGSAVTESIQYEFQFGNPQPNVMQALKYNDNFAASDGNDDDCAGIHGTTDFAAVNCYGTGATRYFRLETPEGNGGSVNLPGGSTSGNCPCTLETQYESGGGGITASSVSTSVAGSTVTWTGTFTPSQWPTGFGFSPASCSGGSNYNGQLFYVVSATGTTLTTSTTGYTNGGTGATASGSTSGCTLTGQHIDSFYNSSGALMGVSFHAGATSPDAAIRFQLGWPSNQTTTSGKLVQWSNWQMSLNLTAPSL